MTKKSAVNKKAWPDTILTEKIVKLKKVMLANVSLSVYWEQNKRFGV
jgi:hypothetical protein